MSITTTMESHAAPASLPGWFMALTALLVLMNGLVFGVFTMVHPELAWPEQAAIAASPIQFFAARHIAFGVVLLHGLLRRDLAVLRTCYTIFFILAVLDFGLLAANPDSFVPVLYTLVGELPRAATLGLSLGLFVLPMGACVAWLRRRGA